MKQVFIQQQHAQRLTLFFAGWGMDARPFADFTPVHSDLMLCYDYTSLDFLLPQGYPEIRVIGWSMGVWAAAQTLQSLNLPITEAIAVNGTLTPVNDENGIPEAIFRGTLDGLNEQNLLKFYRRMCLTGKGLDEFLAVRPQRTVDDLATELRLIGEQSAALPTPQFAWHKAIIGRNDLIFTAEHQQNAWQQTETTRIELDIPHYSARLLRDVVCGNNIQND